MPHNKLYIKKPSGFIQEVNGLAIAPFLYQPTPEGVNWLCRHYSKKYDIDLRWVDLRGKIENFRDIKSYFKYLKESYLDKIEENRRVGLVLNHGQNHTIPVLIEKNQNTTSIVVFDSTSGAIIKGYFGIANLFDNANFYLNSGTRQADSSSCITDAICILKEALQLKDVVSLLEKKQDNKHKAFKSSSRFYSYPKPKNFILFKMPEQLLFTAQLSKYIEEAEADLEAVVVRGKYTLQQVLDHFRIEVSMTHGCSKMVKGINSYLFVKSKAHKDIFDEVLQKEEYHENVIPNAPAKEQPDEEKNEEENDSSLQLVR